MVDMIIIDFGYRMDDLAQNMNWNAPLYWQRIQIVLDGLRKIFAALTQSLIQEPVTNLSYYEADAYAKWNKKRLPTELNGRSSYWSDDLQRKTVFPWGDEN